MMVTVTGTFLKPDDTPCTGAVTFAVYMAASDTTPDDRVVTPAPVVVRLDDAGSFTVDLVASDDAGWQTDGPMPYTIGINVTGQRAYNYAAYINEPGPYDIGDLVVLDWPPNVANVPSAATVDAGTTTTGAPGTDAAVVNSGTTAEAVFDFTIPRGDKGDKGDKGDPGALSSADPAPVGDTNDPGTDLLGSRADHTHAGIRITRPNVDDRLVEQWNGTGWSVVDYDSGWRDVTADVTNATVDSGGSLQMSRRGAAVTLRVGLGLLPAGAGLLSVIYAPPQGWRASYQTVMTTGRRRSDPSLLQDVGIVDGFGVYVPSVPAGSIIFSLYYVTDDPVPTSLPGTLVTSAPQ